LFWFSTLQSIVKLSEADMNIIDKHTTGEP
jgi:hypothetical protein